MRCFQKEDSNPPVCAVHGVRLVLEKVPIDPMSPGRTIECWRCPTTRDVVDELETKIKSGRKRQ